MTDQTGAQRPLNRASGASGLADRHRVIDAPLCGPYALHICTGLSLDIIMASLGARKRSDWKGRTWPSDLLGVLTRLEIPHTPKPHMTGLPVIEVAWPGFVLNPQWPVLIEVSGHFLTLYDGMLFDQNQASIPPKHRFREYTIKNAWQIEQEPNHDSGELLI